MATVDISKIKLPDGTICNLKASGGSSSAVTDVDYNTSTAGFTVTKNGSTSTFQYCETLGATPGSTDPITSGGVSNSLDGIAGTKNRATYSSRTDTRTFASAIQVPLSRPLVSIDNTIYFGSLTVSGSNSIQFGFGKANSVHFQFESVSPGTYTNKTYDTGVWSDGDICDTFFIIAVGGYVSVTFSDLMICPTADFDSQNPYEPPADTLTNLTANKIDTAGSGLSKSGTTLNHSTTIDAKTTSGLFKGKINYTGHITDWTAVDIESSAPSSGSSSLITSGAVYGALPGSATTSSEGLISLSSTYKAASGTYGLVKLYDDWSSSSSYKSTSTTRYAATPYAAYRAYSDAYSDACSYADGLVGSMPKIVYSKAVNPSIGNSLTEVSGLSFQTNGSKAYRLTAMLEWNAAQPVEIRIVASDKVGTVYCYAAATNSSSSEIKALLTCSCMLYQMTKTVVVTAKNLSSAKNYVFFVVEELPYNIY